ncbi:hypothetical protein UK12_33380, partial [Saccharothrix sp. ST-888]
MDELGFLADPARRLGYLAKQMLRIIRVIIDIGMHLELAIPADSRFHPGERWTPAPANEIIAPHPEGWPLQDEHLMHELGCPRGPDRQLGSPDQQMRRGIRVVIHIGLHRELAIPATWGCRPRERWTL